MVSPKPLISGHLFVHLLLQMLLLLPLHDGGRPKKGMELKAVLFQIWIGSGFEQVSGSAENRKKIKISCFEVLDVLF
jgi:hypothetical protein